jgi:hypothetical protein
MSEGALRLPLTGKLVKQTPLRSTVGLPPCHGETGKNTKNSRQLFSLAAIRVKLRSRSIRLETEHNSRRRLRRMSYGIGVEGAESKVRGLIHQPTILRP